MNPVLSIAIPTYNRARYLAAELENIIPQLIPYKEIVEIVISDNCSTDNTREIVAKLSRQYGFPIDYHKQEQNIYFEDNFDYAVSSTRGDYVHLLGDDDLLDPHFYSYVLDKIEKGFGLLFFNRIECDNKCSNGSIYDKSFMSMETHSSPEQFIKEHMASAGFMSALIFNKECWDLGNPLTKNEFYGYRFLGKLYHGALLCGKECIYYYMPWVMMRSAKHDWGNQYKLFYFVGLSNIFLSLDTDIPGIFSNWYCKMHTNSKQNLLSMASVSNNVELYRNKKKEFWPYLNVGERLIYSLMISKISSRFLSAVVTKIISILYVK